MIFYPAIDLINKQCVRLEKGDYSKKTIFNEDPLTQAKIFESDGCSWLHVVDLDAAKNGKSENGSVLFDIKMNTNLKIQFGGGIRSVEKIKEIIELGIDRVILGTAAIQDLSFLEKAAQNFPNKVWLGADVLDGDIKVHGWTKNSENDLNSVLDFASQLSIGGTILTDINKDGMMQGPNIEMTVKIAQKYNFPVILSGGISNIKDIIKLKKFESEGISGLICGRALYDNKVSAIEALKILGYQNA